MKTKSFIIACSVILALSLSFSTEALGQRHGPPAWAPAHGYRAHTRQIYFPRYNFYYDIQRDSYIYFDNGNWVVSINLPPQYSRINLRNSYRVEMELNTDQPQLYNPEHLKKYKGNKHKYYDNAGPYEYQQGYNEDNKHGNKHENKEDKHDRGRE